MCMSTGNYLTTGKNWINLCPQALINMAIITKSCIRVYPFISSTAYSGNWRPNPTAVKLSSEKKSENIHEKVLLISRKAREISGFVSFLVHICGHVWSYA